MTPVPERPLISERPLRVFISYSHDSPEHADRVLALSDRLRADGFDAILDQYEVSPPEGWPRWMDKHIRDADFVLMVCTPTYHRRVMGEEEPGVGLGVRWEGHLIYQHLYAAGTQNARFVPVLMEGGAFADIPAPVQGGTICALTAPDGYDSLRCRLVGQANAPRPPLGPRPRVTDFFQPWNVPHARNPFFTGRDETLAALRAALVGDGAAALTQPRTLSGLGGVGKTQTAVEYAYRHRQDYQAVLWAQADSAPTLLAAFSQIAATLALPEAQAQDLDQTRAAVTRWLAETPSYLLILDNADDPAALRPFLPPSPAGHILLTSRKRDFAALHLGSPLDLPVLPAGEATAFLLRRTDREAADPAERDAAGALADELGGLPLALEQAGAYIAIHQSHFADYLTSYRRRALDLLKKQGPETGDYNTTVAATWSLNFKAVQEASEASAELLRVSAFLAPDAIPEELLLLGASELGVTLAAALDGAGEDPLLLDELLEPLARYSLIRRDTDARTLSIHRLVQAVIQHGMDEATGRDYAERVVGAVARAFPPVEFKNWARCDRLIPHALVCRGHVEGYGLRFPEAAQMLHEAAYFLSERGQYAGALPLYELSLSLDRALSGEVSVPVARCLNNLGWLYLNRAGGAPSGSDAQQSDYRQAAQCCRRALVIRRKLHGQDHHEVAWCLHNLAAVHADQGQYEEASLLFRRSVFIYEAVFETLRKSEPLKYCNIAFSLEGLADVCCRRAFRRVADPSFCEASLREAEAHYQRAGEIRRDHYPSPPGHPHLALSYIGLSLLYHQRHDFEKAISWLETAVKILESVVPPLEKDPTLRRERLRLWEWYRANGKQAEAAALYALLIQDAVDKIDQELSQSSPTH